jgi:hypothetical protein
VEHLEEVKTGFGYRLTVVGEDSAMPGPTKFFAATVPGHAAAYMERWRTMAPARARSPR